MTSEKIRVDAVDLDGKSLLRVGGVSALALGVAYVITILLFAYVRAPPNSGEAWLKYLAVKTMRGGPSSASPS